MFRAFIINMLENIANALQISLQSLLIRDIKSWPGDSRGNHGDRKAECRRRDIYSLLEIIRGDEDML